MLCSIHIVTQMELSRIRNRFPVMVLAIYVQRQSAFSACSGITLSAYARILFNVMATTLKQVSEEALGFL